MNEFKAHTASTGLILVIACSAATFFNPSRALAAAEDRGVEIATLSSRPDTVSGGDVIVEVRVPQSLRIKDIVVELNGVKVTEALLPDRRARRLIGLVSGLALGKNTLTAGMKSRRGHRPFTTLEISNYPASGPIFSGPRQQPWVCETSASGLGDPHFCFSQSRSRGKWHHCERGELADGGWQRARSRFHGAARS
jgi:hypothetical protein